MAWASSHVARWTVFEGLSEILGEAGMGKAAHATTPLLRSLFFVICSKTVHFLMLRGSHRSRCFLPVAA